MVKIQKKNLVLIGMPGCGKSSIGKLIATKLNLMFVDIDAYIEDMLNQKISEIFKQGEDYFRSIETKVVQEVSLKTAMVISTGGGVVKEQKNIFFLKKTGLIAFVNRPLDRIIEDIDTEHRPLLKNNLADLGRLYKERIHLYKTYCDFEVINDQPMEEIVNKLYDYYMDVLKNPTSM